jgi:tetratricopeptide (TPR) repeat protein
MRLGAHERSNSLYRRVIELAPHTSRFWYNLASSERSFGRLVEAETACNRAIALDREDYASYLLRAELSVQSIAGNHVTELRRQLSRPDLDDRGRVVLGYALAKELDDLQQYDDAFQWFAAAAGARRRQLAYDVSVDERKLQRIEQEFSQKLTETEAVCSWSEKFIFIVGLPRSGTTLLEHILTGLANVRSNGETENFSRALLAAAPHGDADIFARAAAADSTVVAANYARLAARTATSDTSMVIEKLPMNYLYLGAIRRSLPKAKILLITRQPVDSCFAMYRTLFGSAYPFSYDFDDLARYYAAYDRLMQHWKKCLGSTLYEVEYESLVKNPAEVGEGTAQHCELAWNPRAIEVEKNASISLTASAAQIRRPIYGSSSGRWRHYRRQLEPLVRALVKHHVPLGVGLGPGDARWCHRQMSSDTFAADSAGETFP